MGMRERIKNECKKKKISVAKLERDLGFANGYISQLNPETIQHGRLVKIADYLDVSVNYLVTGEENHYYFSDEAAEIAMAISDNPELRMLFDFARDSDKEELKALYNMFVVMKRKERNED